MQKRCEEAGIKHAVWSDDHAPPHEARIVFVIAESAITKAFTDFVNSKAVCHQLDRIVFDECHSILQARPNFRRDMWKLQEYAGRSTQLICTTATLPPRKEDAFFATMGLDRRDTTIIRDATTRANIAYSVQEVESEQWEERMKEIVEQKKQQYPPQDKIIVYCSTIEQVKRLATVLGGTAFYSSVGSEAEKARIVEMLKRGSERVFTSTNALGEGIDAPNVRVVIHAGAPKELDDYS